MADIESRLRKLGYRLPDPPAPAGIFVPVVIVGDLAYASGHAAEEGGKVLTGTLGRDLSLKDGQHAARMATLASLASLKAAIGDLSRVVRVVKVLGMVRSTPDFTDHPRVMNGCSQLLVDLFGERGRHARSSVGMASLPAGTAVEIEILYEVSP